MKKYLIILPVCAFFVACGGGDEVAKTSQDCFNEGFFVRGSIVSVVVSVGSSEVDETYEVRDSYVKDGERYVSMSEPKYVWDKRYSIGNGSLKEYGYYGGKPPVMVSKTISPPKVVPVSMDAGQTIRQKYSVTLERSNPSGPSQEVWDAEESRTYIGRETVKTPLGSFASCRFQIKEKLNASGGAASSYSEERNVWIAASGPYRGLVLKTDTVYYPSSGESSTTSKEVVKVNVFNVN